MSWWKRLSKSGHRVSSDTMTALERLELPGWTLMESADDHAEWRNADGDALSLALAEMKIGPEVFSDEGILRTFCRGLAEQRGAGLVEAALVPTAAGSGFRLVYKRLHVPAFVFTGMLVIPRSDDAWVWTMVAGEHGMTGVREAYVTTQLAQAGKLDLDWYENNWARDPYDPTYAGVDRKTLRYVSDAEEYDEAFPNHPLTRVRRELERLRAVAL